MRNTALIAAYVFFATLVLLAPVFLYVGGAYLVLHFVRKFW